MFIGEYQYSIDNKGRFFIPVKLKKDLAPGAVITRGLDNCLFLYPIKEWKILAEKLSKLPISQENTRAFVRLMLAGAMDAKMDKLGRITIPDYLRKYAEIKNKIIITGLYNRLEIWDKKIWDLYKKKTEKFSEKIAEKLSELGI